MESMVYNEGACAELKEDSATKIKTLIAFFLNCLFCLLRLVFELKILGESNCHDLTILYKFGIAIPVYKYDFNS